MTVYVAPGRSPFGRDLAHYDRQVTPLRVYDLTYECN